ncbi:hypothetical protein Goshw_020559, partial [Gossypium schwendimanii]|nr:hypothetical protein [Gossypium schwendimanii]
VLCARLRLLELSSTNIKKLWPDKPDRVISPGVLNLQVLFVKGCHNLEYLFPSFLVKNFEQLETVILNDCENMEEIIFTDGLAAAAEEGIPQLYLFTKLRRLDLIRLPKLRTFCHQENSEINTLFNQKVAFPSLVDLIIVGTGKCRKIWHDKLTMDSFHELTLLFVEHCDKLSNVFPFDMVQRLEKLETLHILECESVEEIIGLAGDHGLNSNESIELQSTTKFMFPKIRDLVLYKLPKLKGFYPKVHTTDWPLLKLLEETFPSLEELVLDGNGNMKGLRQLSLLDCENLEEIIFTDGLATLAEEGIPQTYLFSKLQKLELNRLPKLRTFCHQENSETNTLFNQK